MIITEDKDFGVFLRGMSHPCIIRFVDMPVVEKVAAMRDLVENHSESMTDADCGEPNSDTNSIA